MFIVASQVTLKAAEAPISGGSEWVLPEVEVCAEAPELQSSTYRLIYSLTEEEIEALPAVSVNEILSYLPGIDVRTRGANGAQADINMRGGTFDQVMVLINGINISDPQTGHYSMNLPVSPDLITGIEILEGTAVNLFGTNAFAGAINIITRPNVTDSLRNTCSARLTGGRWGMLDAAFAGQWIRSYGWHVTSAQYSQSTGYQPNTDYRIANLYYGMNYKNLELQVGAQYKDAGANSFYSLASQDQFDATRTAFLSARYHRLWGSWGLDAQASYRANYDRYEWHRGTITNRHLTQTAAASVKGSYAFSWGTTTVGLEVRNEHIFSTALGDELSSPMGIFTKGKNRLHLNYFVQQTMHFGFFSAAAGLQGNWNTMSGSYLVGGVNMGFRFVPQGQIYVNVNRSLRLPTFTDLYYDAGIRKGNVDLKPEKAWTFDLGVRYGYKGLHVQATGYYRIGEDIIDWQKRSGDEILYYAENIPRLDAAGAEVTVGYRYGPWLKNIEVSYTYAHLFLNGVDLAQSMYLDYLSHKAVLRIEHAIYKGFGASWELSFSTREGAYTDMNQQLRSYAPLWLLDGSIYWEKESVRIALECTNMTNAHYYCYGGILQPGILPRATIRLTIP